jgi:hypothetical protein
MRITTPGEMTPDVRIICKVVFHAVEVGILEAEAIRGGAN